MSVETDTQGLVVAIIEFFRNQLQVRYDLALEDRDSLSIAVECLELAYGLENNDPRRRRVRRTLLDMFDQVAHPPSVKDKLQADIFKNEGNEKMSEQMYEEALNKYTQAINLDKWNSIYYCNRSGAYVELGRYIDSLADCRQAINLNPDYAKAYGRMGQTYALMERPEIASRCYRTALELEPDNERYRNNLQTAENLAARAPQGSNMLQNILASFLGAGREDMTNEDFPSSGTLTIITEITPVSSDTDVSEPQVLEDADESNNQTDSNETTTEGHTQPPNPSLLNLILPIIFGNMIRRSGSSSHSDDPNHGYNRSEHRQSGSESFIIQPQNVSEYSQNGQNEYTNSDHTNQITTQHESYQTPENDADMINENLTPENNNTLKSEANDNISLEGSENITSEAHETSTQPVEKKSSQNNTADSDKSNMSLENNPNH